MRIALLALLLTIGCTSMEKGRNGSGDTTPRIAFVTMKATRTEAGTSLSLVDKRVTPGTFKQSFLQPSHSENFILVEVYEEGEMTSSLRLDHPLEKEVEYVDSTGSPAMRHVELPESDFFFRVQLHGAHGLLRFYESIGSDPRRELTTIDLLALSDVRQ
jgi:hypothetical protein